MARPRVVGPAAGTILIALLGSLACATSRFDQLYDAGRYLEAVQSFERDSTIQTDERTLFRAGLIRATPGSPAYSPDRARADFEHLLYLYPRSGYRDEVHRVVLFLVAVEHLERSVADQAAQIDTLSARLAALRRSADRQREILGEQRARLNRLRETAARLEADLRVRELRLRSLREELERLKEIDLKNRRSGGGAAAR